MLNTCFFNCLEATYFPGLTFQPKLRHLAFVRFEAAMIDTSKWRPDEHDEGLRNLSVFFHIRVGP